MLEWTITNTIGWAYGKLADKSCDVVLKRLEKKELNEIIKEHDERMHIMLEQTDINEQIDFSGLQAYVELELEKAILDSILDKNMHSRQEKRNRVHEAAYSSCGADSSTKKQYVSRYLDAIYAFLGTVIEKDVTKLTKVYVNSSIDKLKEEQDTKIKELENKVDSLQPQESPFVQMINSIGDKTESSNQFHYLNNQIEFYGREEEMKAMNDFLQDKRKILFMTIVAPGASGKSKLVYEFVKQHSKDEWWDIKYISGYHIDKLSSFTDYNHCKNIVFIVDYAGLYAGKLGEWMNYLLSMNSNAFSQKIRLIMLERNQAIKIESTIIEPEWKKSFLHSGERKSSLKRIWYHASCFGPNGEIAPLNIEAMRHIMKQYALKLGTELQEKELDNLLEYLQKVDNADKGNPRPLFALFIVDAYIHNHDVHNWDSNAMIEHCIERTEQKWMTLCDSDSELFNHMREMILYATATEGMLLNNIPEALKKAEDCLNKLDDEAYLKLICGINQENQYRDILCPMEPDIVGEYYLFRSFIKATGRKERLKQRTALYWEKTEHFFNVIARTIQDHGAKSEIKRFLQENLDLILPPDRNELEIEAHSRLLHFMLIKFKGARNQAIFAGKIKALYEKYPDHKVVINDYAATLMLEGLNHIGREWEQEENVEKIRRLWENDLKNDYLLTMYGKGIANLISGYIQGLFHVNKEQARFSHGQINYYYDQLCKLEIKYPKNSYLKKARKDMERAIVLYKVVKSHSQK